MDRKHTREESHEIIFPIVQEIFNKTKLAPRDIDFLIVNCSLYAPTPSLCAEICHKFGLRHDVRTYNLGGMGCSANVISVDLAKQLLQNEPGTRALVVSTEMITPNLYLGNDKSMLLQNSLFRCGGVALLLSSRWRDSSRAKYELLYTQRTQISDDESFGAVFEKEDKEGHRGVALSKQIVEVAGRTMTKNLTHLAPKVLPYSELARVGLNRCLIAVIKKARKAGMTQREVPKAYLPNWSRGIDHFCIHAGGRAVIDGVQKGLRLDDKKMEPSRQTLHEWGNTSSSSIWYEAEYIERFSDLRIGDRVLQIAFGSGFKCNTAVWRTLRVDSKKRGVAIKAPPEGKVLPSPQTENPNE
jgi:3-ketoacyl-CoA synthase